MVTFINILGIFGRINRDPLRGCSLINRPKMPRILINLTIKISRNNFISQGID